MSEAATWQLPALGGQVLPGRRRSENLTAIEREAWEQGHAQGREAGLAAAQQGAREGQVGILAAQHAAGDAVGRVLQLKLFLELLARRLADLFQQVQRQLALLAGAIARHIIRRELKTQPDEIVAVVRETVGLLPIVARQVRVHLHPEDAELVRSRLASASGERAWSIVEDPMLARGGCRVTSETSSIDAQLEQRLGAAIATMLGDERTHSSANAPATAPEA